MQCDSCGQAEAAFLTTLLDNGDTQAQCPGCFAQAGFRLGLHLLSPEQIAQGLAELGPPPGAEEEGTGRRRSPRKRAGTTEFSVVQTEPASEGLAEAEAASDDA